MYLSTDWFSDGIEHTAWLEALWNLGNDETLNEFFCWQLIKPEEMVNPKVDELSMMTYLSQFPNAKLKPGAPLRPRTNPARVRAYGPGGCYEEGQ